MPSPELFKNPPAWMRGAGFDGRTRSALIVNEILTAQQLFALCQLGPEELRKLKGCGELTVERLLRWALQHGGNPPLEPKPERRTGIKRVVRFETPDGKTHPSYGEARTHLSRHRLVEWCSCRYGGVMDPEELAAALLADWHISPKKKEN